MSSHLLEVELPEPVQGRRLLVATWGLAGIALLFGHAILRLGTRAADTIAAGLEPLHWSVLVLLTVAFVYGEGVRAIQGKFAPAVVERLHALIRSGSAVWQLFAPLYLLALVGASPRTIVRAWFGIAAIIVAVLVVSSFPDPWRGIVDFAVAAALLWGLMAIVAAAVRSLR